jgi:hypothetical protein
MMMRKTTRAATLVALATAMSGCAQAGALGDILGTVLGGGQGQGQGQGQLVAEVQQVDTRQQAIHVRTQQGQTGALRYDANTQVIYQQQQYPVTALERGDIASFEIQQMQNNEVYVSRVMVQQSVQERTGQTGTQGGADVYQFSGRVGQINGQAGVFELQTSSGTVTVSMSANATAADVQRFRSLRTGDSISMQGRYVAANMVELQRFL